MSSATSIERVDADRVRDEGAARERSGAPRDAFQPWHFFVIASLMAATAAVVMARQSRPEQLVVISLTIGAAGFAAAALYRTLVPLVRPAAPAAAGPLSESGRAAMEREKLLVLRSIKDLEFDRAMGKLSSKDFDEMAGRLRARAMVLMRQLDAGGGYQELIERELGARVRTHAKRARPAAAPPVGAAPPPPAVEGAGGRGLPGEGRGTTTAFRTCPCGTENDADASFCKRCGTPLTSAAS